MRPFGQASEYVMEVIRGYGCDSSESSRLARMRDLLRQGFIPETDPNFELACEAVRDITLLEFAFEQLAGRVHTDALRKRIVRLMKDSPLPQDDRGPTPGRDIQMELFAAAICQAAGLSPRFEEPDLVIGSDGHSYGLAVKRLKSLRQLEKRFRAAVGQIDDSRIPGFVVLEVTLALNPGNRRLAFRHNDDALRHWARKWVSQLVDKYFDRFRTWRAGREVRGIVVHYHQVCRSDSTGLWWLYSFNEFASLDPKNQRRRREGERFWKAYEGGIPNAVQL